MILRTLPSNSPQLHIVPSQARAAQTLPLPSVTPVGLILPCLHFQAWVALPLVPAESTRTRVRFGSTNPATLHQQVYSAALPVWDVDFAFSACVNTVALDDNSYAFLTFLSGDDAQGFVNAWHANRIKSESTPAPSPHRVGFCLMHLPSLLFCM